MERIDDLQFGGLKLIQDSDYFCFGTDAVLLAGFARVKPGERVADLGAGTGILAVLLAGSQPDARFFGIEIQEELAVLARRSVELNGQRGRIEIIHGDIAGAVRLLGNGFDAVVANPPYEKADDGEARKNESQRIARKEVKVTLDGVVEAANGLLRIGGRLYLVHKPTRLAELMYKLKQRGLEPKTLRFVCARESEEPNLVLVHAVKGAREGVRVLPQLVFYGADGRETEEIRKIYHME